ncbi:MAG: PadR family transcriptional regulator [Candidatus Marinimicrobia bacterium]|nr:PadR family transcriptional regulator [Candidatus Neomarinimicrobiota bacterium]
MTTSVIDLILLGQVIRKPLGAYDLAHLLHKHNLSDMVRISKPAIYSNIRKLLERGYLEGRITKTRRRPEKRVCYPTEKGRARFQELMAHFAAQPVRYHFDFNALIISVSQLPREAGEPLLEQLRTGLEEQRRLLKERLKAPEEISFAGQSVIRQQYLLNEALLKWFKEFRGEHRARMRTSNQ